jgi:hypothetical protein
MLSNMEKIMNVNEALREWTDASQYTYNSCTLFTFFNTGRGTDICFFSIYFQLYGCKCPDTIRNSAYISYIDSINLLPSNKRTRIYRMILLGLFAYLKTKGFNRIFLWSCPPKQNQDYIFYMKPPKMKMPSKARLSNWYMELFKLGAEFGVIHQYLGVHQHALAERWQNVGCLPLIEGDLWIPRMEEAVAITQKETEKLCNDVIKLKEKLKAGGTKNAKDGQKTQLKKKLEEIRAYDKTAKMWKLINYQVRFFNSEYFVIQLSSEEPKVDASMQQQTIIDRLWISDRHILVDFFWENMLEFCDERRAQFSTHVMLYRVLVESQICIQCGMKSINGVNGALLCVHCHVVAPSIRKSPEDSAPSHSGMVEDSDHKDQAVVNEEIESNDTLVKIDLACIEVDTLHTTNQLLSSGWLFAASKSRKSRQTRSKCMK